MSWRFCGGVDFLKLMNKYILWDKFSRQVGEMPRGPLDSDTHREHRSVATEHHARHGAWCTHARHFDHVGFLMGEVPLYRGHSKLRRRTVVGSFASPRSIGPGWWSLWHSREPSGFFENNLGFARVYLLTDPPEHHACRRGGNFWRHAHHLPIALRFGPSPKRIRFRQASIQQIAGTKTRCSKPLNASQAQDWHQPSCKSESKSIEGRKKIQRGTPSNSLPPPG